MCKCLIKSYCFYQDHIEYYNCMEYLSIEHSYKCTKFYLMNLNKNQLKHILKYIKIEYKLKLYDDINESKEINESREYFKDTIDEHTYFNSVRDIIESNLEKYFLKKKLIENFRFNEEIDKIIFDFFDKIVCKENENDNNKNQKN